MPHRIILRHFQWFNSKHAGSRATSELYSTTNYLRWLSFLSTASEVPSQVLSRNKWIQSAQFMFHLQLSLTWCKVSAVHLPTLTDKYAYWNKVWVPKNNSVLCTLAALVQTWSNLEVSSISIVWDQGADVTLLRWKILYRIKSSTKKNGCDYRQEFLKAMTRWKKLTAFFLRQGSQKLEDKGLRWEGERFKMDLRDNFFTECGDYVE